MPWEEALVDRYWFFPQFWQDSGMGSYSVVWHTYLLLAAHLSVFHTAMSICSSVLAVEWLAPRARHRPWISRPGLGLACLVLAVTPVIYGEFDQRPPPAVLLAAGFLLTAIVVTAFLVGRRRRPVSWLRTDPGPYESDGVRVVVGCDLRRLAGAAYVELEPAPTTAAS